MRKTVLLLAVLLILTGCGSGTQGTVEGSTEAPTQETMTEFTTEAPTAPEATEPAWEPGTARFTGIGVQGAVFRYDDRVRVLGQLENHFIIQGTETELLVPVELIRTEDEEDFAASSGWTLAGTAVYATAYRDGAAIHSLPLNTQVRVLDGKGSWLRISWDDCQGYAQADQISSSRIPVSTGGGSQGVQDGTDVDIGGLAADGTGEISLLWDGTSQEVTFFDQPKAGRILSPGTEAYLYLLTRGETVKVTASDEETCTLLLGQQQGTVPRWAVRLEEDDVYEPWTAYAGVNAEAYADHRMTDSLRALAYNERVRVVDLAKSLKAYLVELAEGFAWVPMDMLSETELPVYSGGGNSGGDVGWTPPAL